MKRPYPMFKTTLCAALLAVSPAFMVAPAAMAAVPHDIGYQDLMLWLDGYDISGRDRTNGTDYGTTIDSYEVIQSATISQWQDKSNNRFITASAGGESPSYTARHGVRFDNAKTGMTINRFFRTRSLPGMTVVAVGSYSKNPYSYIFSANGNAIAAQFNNVDNNLTNPSPIGAFNVMASGNNRIVGNVQGTDTGSISAVFYNPVSVPLDGKLFIGSRTTDPTFYHDGEINEIMIYSKPLPSVDVTLLRIYHQGKYPASIHPRLLDNPFKQFYDFPSHPYHIGGLGFLYGSRRFLGTSAGLSMAIAGIWPTEGTELLVAGQRNRLPDIGTMTNYVPTGILARSKRDWAIRNSSAGALPTRMWFNLQNIGMGNYSNSRIALLSRNSDAETYKVVAVADAANGAVEFTLPNVPTGLYALGVAGPANLEMQYESKVVDGPDPQVLQAHVPGAILEQTITVTNKGYGDTDLGSNFFELPILPNTDFYAVDFGYWGEGPVKFIQGRPSSGLDYLRGQFLQPASTTDSIDFSNDDGATWTYISEVLKKGGAIDPNINRVRLRLTGKMVGTADGINFPNFQLKYKLRIR